MGVDYYAVSPKNKLSLELLRREMWVITSSRRTREVPFLDGENREELAMVIDMELLESGILEEGEDAGAVHHARWLLRWVKALPEPDPDVFIWNDASFGFAPWRIYDPEVKRASNRDGWRRDSMYGPQAGWERKW